MGAQEHGLWFEVPEIRLAPTLFVLPCSAQAPLII
jgi:hypothetical protein